MSFCHGATAPKSKLWHKPFKEKPQSGRGAALGSWAGNTQAQLRHCEPTGPAQSGRPGDRLREATQSGAKALDCFVALLLAMTSQWVRLSIDLPR
jgi:hypothetical protein